MDRVPVHIITGFLGSGKTTFLNHFINELLPERIFVVENEFGSASVDGALIMEGVEEVVELSAGCLCCSLADGLFDILQEAASRRGEYDRMVIETTGIADPGSIVQVFLEDPRVSRIYELQQVICLAEAALIEEWLSETEEALRQISMADVLLVNKVDRVSSDKQTEVEELLQGINPQALVLAGQEGNFPIEKILKVNAMTPKLVEKDFQIPLHSGVHDYHQITTFTLSFSHPLDLDQLTLDLTRIVMLYRHQVYRVKGIIAVPQYPNRVILQSARSAFVATDGAPWAPDEAREGKLVFIGRGLKKEVFAKMFNRHMQIAE